jgi:hypothetical protein
MSCGVPYNATITGRRLMMARTSIWTEYDVRFNFLTKLCGSVPADPEIIDAWTRARAPKVRPAGARSIDEIQEEVFETIAAGEAADLPEYTVLMFQRVEGVCCMRAATVRAHLKDCARVISAQLMPKVKGERAFSTRVINGVYVDERQYWLPILRPDGTPVSKHDGETDKAIHVRGPRGEQLNAIKRFEWIEPARLDFRLKILGESVRREDLEKLLEYGGVHGYAGERGDGEGRYVATISEVA